MRIFKKEADIDMQGTGQENNSGKENRRRAMLMASILLAILLVGSGLTARYISSNKKQAEMTSSQFHFTSNYLEEVEASYDITDWSDGFDILLYNYEKENIAQIAGDEIKYQVAVSNGWICTDSGNGTMGKSSNRETVTLHIAPPSGATSEGEVKVTVTTTSPYKKELSAVFRVTTKRTPDYTITDRSDGTVLLTIHANDYSGDMTVKWDAEKFDPDNSNDLMVNWHEEGIGEQTKEISVEANHTYELLFFKNTADVTITAPSGTGTTATVK